jgi:hypothetical protein
MKDKHGTGSEDKKVLEDVWKEQPCNNPLEPAQWVWVTKYAAGSVQFILTCRNSLWSWYSK